MTEYRLSKLEMRYFTSYYNYYEVLQSLVTTRTTKINLKKGT